MPVTAAPPRTGQDLVTVTDGEFARFADLIRDQTGIHLADHKRQLLVARLGQRLRTLGLKTFSAYFQFLIRDASGEELLTLINRVTTNKTSFFRESHHFDFMRTHIIPRHKQKGIRRLRVWSAGCSSGEEPYSIAITLLEALGTHTNWDLRILATDIDSDVLRQAGEGTYDLESLEDVPPELRSKYFLRGFGEFEGLAKVRPQLRKLVAFRRLNLVQPEWGIHEHFDLVFCRNVIIYFERPVQDRIVRNLAGHLHPDGHYFSGHSENLHYLHDMLAVVEPSIYQLRPGGPSA